MRALALLLLCSCAGIAEYDGVSTMKLSSEPTGATWTTDTGLEGTTPAAVKLDNRTEYLFTFTHPDYPDVLRESKPGMSPWIVGNIPLAFVIPGVPALAALGLVVDVLNPGARRHPFTMRVDFTEETL